jgi:hypothetical protein
MILKEDVRCQMSVSFAATLLLTSDIRHLTSSSLHSCLFSRSFFNASIPFVLLGANSTERS